MSVRATNSLIAEIVIASGLPNSPKMVVQDVNPDSKTVTTVWFSDGHEVQQGIFPTGALNKVEAPVVPEKRSKTAAAAPKVSARRR